MACMGIRKRVILRYYFEQVENEASIYSYKGVSEGCGGVCFMLSVCSAGRLPLIMFEMLIRHPKREIQEVAGCMNRKCEDQSCVSSRLGHGIQPFGQTAV